MGLLRRLTAGLLAAAVACASLPAPVLAETGVTDSEILIGACGVLQQDLGQVVRNGATAYINYVNDERGGVNGRKVRVLWSDDKFTSAGANECMQRMQKEGVFALAFVATGAAAIEYVTFAMANKVPLLMMPNAAPFMYEPVKRYVFGTRPTYTEEAYGIVDAFYRNLGLRRFGVIYMSDGLGFAGLDGVRKALKAHKLSAVAEASFMRLSMDLNAQVDAVRAADPEAVIIAGNYRQGAAILKLAQKKHWAPRFALVTARPGVSDEAGSAAEGLVMAQLYPDTSRTDLPAVALFRRLMDKYEPGARQDMKTLEGFVDAMITIKGLEMAGPKPTREGVIAAFERMKDVDLGLGRDFRVTFSAKKHQGFNHEDFSVVRDGRSVPIDDWAQLRPR